MREEKLHTFEQEFCPFSIGFDGEYVTFEAEGYDYVLLKVRNIPTLIVTLQRLQSGIERGWKVEEFPRKLAEAEEEDRKLYEKLHQLDREMAVYVERFPEFLEEHEGAYVLIHRDDVLGFFGSMSEALHHLYQNVGNVPCLAKKIERSERLHRMIQHSV